MIKRKHEKTVDIKNLVKNLFQPVGFDTKTMGVCYYTCHMQ